MTADITDDQFDTEAGYYYMNLQRANHIVIGDRGLYSTNSGAWFELEYRPQMTYKGDDQIYAMQYVWIKW